MEAEPRRQIVWMRLVSEVRDTEPGVRDQVDQVIREGRPRRSCDIQRRARHRWQLTQDREAGVCAMRLSLKRRLMWTI